MRLESHVNDKDMKPPKGKGLGSVANMLVHCGATEEKAKEVASEAYKRVVMAKIERKDRTQYRKNARSITRPSPR